MCLREVGLQLGFRTDPIFSFAVIFTQSTAVSWQETTDSGAKLDKIYWRCKYFTEKFHKIATKSSPLIISAHENLDTGSRRAERQMEWMYTIQVLEITFDGFSFFRRSVLSSSWNRKRTVRLKENAEYGTWKQAELWQLLQARMPMRNLWYMSKSKIQTGMEKTFTPDDKGILIILL